MRCACFMGARHPWALPVYGCVAVVLVGAVKALHCKPSHAPTRPEEKLEVTIVRNCCGDDVVVPAKVFLGHRGSILCCASIGR